MLSYDYDLSYKTNARRKEERRIKLAEEVLLFKLKTPVSTN